MPINLERSLINSNLDSYLGEAGLGGWAECARNVNVTMELEPQEGRSSGNFTSAQLSSISLSGMNKSHQRQIFGTQITLVILFLCLQ